jgi:hypothetical protein
VSDSCAQPLSLPSEGSDSQALSASFESDFDSSTTFFGDSSTLCSVGGASPALVFCCALYDMHLVQIPDSLMHYTVIQMRLRNKDVCVGPHGTLRELPLPRHSWKVPPHLKQQAAVPAGAGTSTTAQPSWQRPQHVIS